MNKPGGITFQEETAAETKEDTLIVVITVTYRTVTRIPDLFTLGNTLTHVRDLFWVVVDNSTNSSVDAVAGIVQRANLPSVLVNVKSQKNNTNTTTLVELYNYGLDYVRIHMSEYKQTYKRVVVYFADVDYSYDLRLWSGYVRKVEKLGLWPVGRPLKKSSKEQKNLNETEMKSPLKYFDLSNTAFNADLILDPPVQFEEKCNLTSPELCFVKDLKMPRDQIQFFENEEPGDLLVWHAPKGYERFLYHLDLYNYLVEVDPAEQKPK